MVRVIIAAKLPIIRPRWSAWRSKPGLPIGGTSISVIALDLRLLSPAVRHESACARNERAIAGRYRGMECAEEKEEGETFCARGIQSLLRRYQRGPDTEVDWARCSVYPAVHDAGPCLDPKLTGSSGGFCTDWLSLMLRLRSSDS